MRTPRWYPRWCTHEPAADVTQAPGRVDRLESTMSACENKYRLLANKLMAVALKRIRPPTDVAPELRAAELRLEVPLPAPLWVYYEAIDQHAAVNDA